jgi:predicted enzyme related to lactoylglutathione lyase
MDPMRGRSERHWWGVVLEAPDARELAEFYAQLFGWTVAKSEPDWATLGPPDGVAYIGFQTSPYFRRPTWPPVSGEQQMMMHLDIEVEDLELAVADAVALGGKLSEHQPQDDVRVLLDPAGHPFCLYLETPDD